MSLLIIGGTGTLGRQIVLQALTKGYQVRCLVRNFRNADFLKSWGVELVYGDLTQPETIPPCLKGITAVIDASTSRPNELNSLMKVDWYGKLYLLEAVKVANIRHFIFFSIYTKDNIVSNIQLLKSKRKTEIQIMKLDIPCTAFGLTGFYQGLIGQYAIPILENLSIWVNDNYVSYMEYMDTQDIAKFCLRSLQLPKTIGQWVSLNELTKKWTSSEIINLCEQLAGQSANVKNIPFFFLELTSYFFGFFEWGQNINDRLRFVEVLPAARSKFMLELSEIFELDDYLLEYFVRLNQKHDYNFFVTSLNATNDKKLSLFKLDLSEILQLEYYLVEYFIRLLKRLRDINFEDVQKQKNLVI